MRMSKDAMVDSGLVDLQQEDVVLPVTTTAKYTLLLSQVLHLFYIRHISNILHYSLI